MRPVSATRYRQGFTLIELLVVMVLMALLSAAALTTLNFAAGDEDIETEARRIGALVSLAAEEALLTGREIGLEL
ncbi:MAG: prepilin-type N-terminal cleavage/methylation domain-containing protein, partial [Gammaproteobacteria bacterium]|nr:prepilin-type N-terminal cleavage/methylation domain-containing protein [Gammaproteobacteria bacterium]